MLGSNIRRNSALDERLKTEFAFAASGALLVRKTHTHTKKNNNKKTLNAWAEILTVTTTVSSLNNVQDPKRIFSHITRLQKHVNQNAESK